MTKDVLRRVRFRPYVGGHGPTFTLTTWATGRTRYGKDVLGYRLAASERGRTAVVFEAEDFGCAPTDCVDSDATVRGVMAFLTCRPGDTDPLYFADYTPAQLDYCRRHAEALAAAVESRFPGPAPRARPRAGKP